VELRKEEKRVPCGYGPMTASDPKTVMEGTMMVPNFAADWLAVSYSRF
jgi:hypothetical protein